MIAADIDDCIEQTIAAVTHWAGQAAESLYDHLQNWEATFVQFNDDSVDQRTVRNWKVPTHRALQGVPAGIGDQTIYAQDVFRVVFQACCAAKFAQIDGRITTAQRNQFVTDWNTCWGF